MAKVIKASGLDAALELILSPPRKPEEFTAEDFQRKSKEAGHMQSIDAVRMALNRSTRAGFLESRKATENGRRVTLYRLKK